MTMASATNTAEATESVDCVVIGAGVIGLACAHALAAKGREVLILEADKTFGSGASSRNSEVIHAGLYYPEGSLKASLCVRGKALLYEYCAQHHVAHKRCGKLVVATSPQQIANLHAIQAQALRNGVSDLELLDRADAQRLEPELDCVAALLSPSTGIVDSHGLMLSLLGQAELAGATLVLRTPVLAGSLGADGRLLLHTGGDMPMRLAARAVINASGLFAPLLARRLPRLSAVTPPVAHLAKGNYFSLQARSPFSRLVYPVPEPGGLGVHLTLDLQGRARFGPDVEWLVPPANTSEAQTSSDLNYTVDPDRASRFESEIRRYWPALPTHALLPDYAGIRAKISGPGEASRDFYIETAAEHGISGLINLMGIESPGLTSSLAIGEHVASRLFCTTGHRSGGT